MLDFLASKLRLKNGEPREEDYQVLQKYLGKLHELWGLAKLNCTPKNALFVESWARAYAML
jgi:hypothetical protein